MQYDRGANKIKLWGENIANNITNINVSKFLVVHETFSAGKERKKKKKKKKKKSSCNCIIRVYQHFLFLSDLCSKVYFIYTDEDFNTTLSDQIVQALFKHFMSNDLFLEKKKNKKIK